MREPLVKNGFRRSQPSLRTKQALNNKLGKHTIDLVRGHLESSCLRAAVIKHSCSSGRLEKSQRTKEEKKGVFLFCAGSR